MAKLNTCVECKINVARHWGSNLCENCFREILKEELNKDEPRKSDS